MIEVQVQSLGIDQVSKTPVVILQELEGERVLPIWIGPGEASAIAMELSGMKFSRPLTHDLTASIVRGMGGALGQERPARPWFPTSGCARTVLKYSEAARAGKRWPRCWAPRTT